MIKGSGLNQHTFLRLDLSNFKYGVNMTLTLRIVRRSSLEMHSVHWKYITIIFMAAIFYCRYLVKQKCKTVQYFTSFLLVWYFKRTISRSRQIGILIQNCHHFEIVFAVQTITNANETRCPITCVQNLVKIYPNV